MRRLVPGALVLVLCLGGTAVRATAFRGAASASKASAKASSVKPAQTIDIEMNAISFDPKVVRVKAGKLVRFRFHNGTNVAHEALIGDDDAQKAHEKMRKSLGDKPMAHAPSKGYVLVPAGATATLDYTFPHAGRTLIGCHQPGHWPSGMRITVAIDPATSIG